jgi:transcriptional regulator of arginine metabolism
MHSMKTRTRRLLEIRKLISGSRIASQDELLQKLLKKGFQYTQATLSRDLKFLKVGKISDSEKGMVYVLPESSITSAISRAEEPVTASGFVSIDFSHNLGVIKTLPGFASSMAYGIDQHQPFEIIGTIAGDDTILIIGREGARKSDILKALAMLIPEIETKT